MRQTVARDDPDAHRLLSDVPRPRPAKALTNRESQAKVLTGSDDDRRRAFGWIVERTVQIAGLTNSEAADRLGVDRAQFQRWISGAENTQAWRIQQDAVMGPAFIEAQGEVTAGVEFETRLVVRRQRPWNGIERRRQA